MSDSQPPKPPKPPKRLARSPSTHPDTPFACEPSLARAQSHQGAELSSVRRQPAAVWGDRPKSMSQSSMVDIDVTVVGEQFEGRYHTKRLLGDGGMGEVKLIRDERIGRDIAMKVVRDKYIHATDILERFRREARVQGQLEHPAIVPVYDLGVTPEGAAYFTMKRIRGLTLEEITVRLRKGDPELKATYSDRRILTTLLRVAQALAYAHQHGVVHRDIKPENIIVGNYGEVYIIDWGLAKIFGAEEPSRPSDQLRVDDTTIQGQTEAGAVLGTPGYLAPEQAYADGDVDHRADIYALGVIIFETLTLTPLHKRGKAEDVLASTVKGVDARPSVRAPHRNFAPELDRLCVAATALNRDNRYHDMLDVAETIERYLDGGRDTEARRQMAERHVEAARPAARDARSNPQDVEMLRARALRELNAAVSLDSTNDAALRAMGLLLSDVPEKLPPEAAAELESERAGQRAEFAKALSLAFLTGIVLFGVNVYVGVGDTVSFLFSIVLFLGIGLLLWRIGAHGRATKRHMFSLVALTAAIGGSTTTGFGALFIVPSIICALTLLFIVAMRMDRKMWMMSLGIGILGVLVPAFLQDWGYIRASYTFHEGGVMCIQPWGMPFDASTTLPLLMGVAVLTIGVPAAIIGIAVERFNAAEEKLFAHAWYMRQLMPTEVQRGQTERPPATD